MVALAEDVALRRGIAVVDVPDLDLGVFLLEPQDDLFQIARVRAPPREDDTTVLLVGILLGLEDFLDDPLGDRTPERGVPVGSRRPVAARFVAAGGEGRVQQQHALREHRLEPFRRLDGVLLLQKRAYIGDRGLLGYAVLPHRRRLDDAADADDPAELAIFPVVEGVVEHGDAGGALRPRVRILAEDDDFPFVRRIGLERLEGQFADGDDLRPAARADERGRVRLRLDDRLQQRKPWFTTAFEQIGQSQRVIRVIHVIRVGLGRGGGIAHWGGTPHDQTALIRT
nr:hypothetical protein [Streptomyces sp. MST-110588]